MVSRYIRVEDNNGGRGRPIGLVMAERLDNNRIRFGFSLCHPSDPFNRQMARQIAEGRLRSNDYTVTNFSSSYDTLENHFGDHAKSVLSISEQIDYVVDEVINRETFRAKN